MAEKKKTSSLVNMDSPQRRRLAATNIVNVYNHTHPALQRSGRDWYAKVNDAVSKGVRGTSTSEWGGAGLVAAVSPNMDWENNNIHAISELHALKGQQWSDIAKGDRSPLKGLSISRATQGGLLKAHRIMQGEDPDDVLSRRTAPKTNSFAHNIARPDHDGHVTIDGRAHDIAANSLKPWTQGRGIGSAALPSGKTSRYEHFENSYRTAAHAISGMEGQRILPHELQAVTWEGGKVLERSAPTKSGKPRQKGVARKGQPYVGRNGLV